MGGCYEKSAPGSRQIISVNLIPKRDQSGRGLSVILHLKLDITLIFSGATVKIYLVYFTLIIFTTKIHTWLYIKKLREKAIFSRIPMGLKMWHFVLKTPRQTKILDLHP